MKTQYSTEKYLKGEMNLTKEKLDFLLESCGLADDADIEVMSPWLGNCNTILELCFGYGRVIDYITRYIPHVDVTAIEIDKELVSLAKDKYKGGSRLIEGDLLKINELGIDRLFDSIILTWGTFTLFNPKEQAKIIKDCSKLLRVGGKFFVEQPAAGGFKDHLKEVSSIIMNDNTLIEYHMMSHKELSDAATLNGLHLSQIYYEPGINKLRLINVFTKE